MTKADSAEYVERYSDLILRLSFTYLGSSSDAEDIVQDVLIKLMLNAPPLSSPEHEKAWVIRTTANRCKDVLKGAHRKRSVRFDETTPHPTAPSAEDVFMLQQSGDRTLMGRTAHAQFGNFRVTGYSYENAPVMAAGDWNLSFVIDCEDASVEVAADEPFGTPSGEALMTGLTVSPIAVTVEYAYGESEVGPDAVDTAADDVSEAHVAGDVTILMDDGSTVVVENNGGMSMQWNDDGSLTCSQSLFLPQIVDVAHVSSITVGGTEFPVK